MTIRGSRSGMRLHNARVPGAISQGLRGGAGPRVALSSLFLTPLGLGGGEADLEDSEVRSHQVPRSAVVTAGEYGGNTSSSGWGGAAGWWERRTGPLPRVRPSY